MYRILFLFGCAQLIGTNNTIAFRIIEDVIPSYKLPELTNDLLMNDEYMLSIVEMNNPLKKISFIYENDQQIT